jgi:hypothetical protein
LYNHQSEEKKAGFLTEADTEPDQKVSEKATKTMVGRRRQPFEALKDRPPDEAGNGSFSELSIEEDVHVFQDGCVSSVDGTHVAHDVDDRGPGRP